MDKWEETVSQIELKELTSLEDKYDYVACFDENGSESAIFQMYKAMMSGSPVDENRRYFTLSCCLFSRNEYDFSKNIIIKLKNQYFKKIENPVVLHTRDIVKRVGPFNFGTKQKYDRFISSLSNAVQLIKCKIISVTFDLFSYVKQDYKYDPYEVAFDIVLTGIRKCVGKNKKVALVFESRGKNEDKLLYKHIYKIINVTGMKVGDKKTSKEEIRECFDEAFFNHKVSKDGLFAYPGIEIADLCSYPIYRYMRYGTEGKDFEIVKEKIVADRSGILQGLRSFPEKWDK